MWSWHRRSDEDFTEEIRANIALETHRLIAEGMNPDEARTAALRTFGNVTRAQERFYEARRMLWLDDLRRDVSYAFRTLLKNPGFTTVAVVTLALGIGATTAIFGLIEVLVLRHLPVRDPRQLIVLSRSQDGITGEHFNYPQVQHLSEQTTLFRSLAGFTSDAFNVGPIESSEPIGGAWVSGHFYETLGIVPTAGRLLGPDDDRPGAPPAVVISDNFWAQRYGRDPTVVGQTVLIEGVAVPIVGISPRGFRGAIVGEAADLTLAVSVLPQLQPERASMIGPGGRWLRIIGRPHLDLSLQQLEARLAVVWLAYLETTTSPNLTPEARKRGLSSTLGVHAGATGASALRTQFRQPLTILMGVVGLVLMIACVNVANLMLARNTARHREMNVRLAIGASRLRVIRQLLTESAVLAIVGAALGILLASLGRHLLVGLIASGGTGPSAPDQATLDLGLNWRVLGFTVVVTIATAVASGVMPAFRGTLAAPAAALTAGVGRVTAPRRRVASALVAVQLSASLVLLVGAGLFIRTLQNLRSLDRGFRHEGVLLVGVDAQRAGYKGPALRAFNQQALARVEQMRGVDVASLSAMTPLMGGGISMVVSLPGDGQRREEMHVNVVAPRYFEAMNTPIVLGRDFAARDDESAPRVAIVNETFVRAYLPGRHPIGQRLLIGGVKGEIEIVGVVRDAVYQTLKEPPPPTVYGSYAQMPGVGAVILVVHAPRAVTEVAAAIRADLQPQLAGKPLRMRTLTTQLEGSLVRERLMATLGAAFSGLALLLAAIGLYGLLTYSVVQRTSEIGIRLALGARPSQILKLVMSDAARMLATGMTIGLPIAWASSRLVASMLFGLAPTDARTTGSALAVLVVTAVLAAVLPARRATKVDPLVALRCD
jgi:predicted permease